MAGARMHGRSEKFYHISLRMEILLRTHRWEDNIKIDIREKLALTSPTRAGPSVGIVPLRTKATEFSFFLDLKEI
jgi:hypothetical protein